MIHLPISYFVFHTRFPLKTITTLEDVRNMKWNKYVCECVCVAKQAVFINRTLPFAELCSISLPSPTP